VFKDKEKRKAYDTNWNNLNRQRKRDINKKWKAKQQEAFQSIKNLYKCYFCSEANSVCLDFHHVNPKTKKFNVAKMSGSFSMENLLNEISKCVVLCANCHRKLHANLLPDPFDNPTQGI